MSFGNAFLDLSNGAHGSEDRAGCAMPGGVGGVDPGAPAPPPVCWGGVPFGIEPDPEPPPGLPPGGGGGGGGFAPPDPLPPPDPVPPPDGLLLG